LVASAQKCKKFQMAFYGIQAPIGLKVRAQSRANLTEKEEQNEPEKTADLGTKTEHTVRSSLQAIFEVISIR